MGKHKIYTSEQLDRVAQLKRSGITNSEICAQTGVNINKVKQVVKTQGLLLSKEQAQKNAYEAKLRKNPDAMVHMRKSLDAAARKRASVSLKKTYSDPKYFEIFSKSSKKNWAKRAEWPQEKREAFFKKRNIASSEAKLGMSLDSYDALLETVRQRALDTGFPVSRVAQDMGLPICTILRKFHAKGWSDLISASKCSSGQREIFNFIQYLAPDVLLNDRSALARGAELDIYVPSKKFGLEYNGLYWHSEAAEGWRTRKHLYKKIKCEEAGIALLAVYEDEWEDPNKQVLIKSMIKHRLGVQDQVRVGARKLDLVYMESNSEYESFFDKNHLDGHKKSSYAWGLVDKKGDLVMCASFGINREGLLEINRMATRQGYFVPGGASRLISNIKQDLYSYSNNRLSDGNVYKQLGFARVPMSDQPSYWYTDGNVRIWRFKCRRNNDPEILNTYPTEKLQAMNGVFSPRFFGDNRPLFRIEDYGHKKWVLKYSPPQQQSLK